MTSLAVPVAPSPPHGPNIRRELIGPDQAEAYLSKMPRNRQLRTAWVNQLAQIMRDGKYQDAGDTIRFAITGELLDGQHRLRAIIQSGVSLWFWVVYDLPVESQDVMDRGQKRTVADVMHIHGYSNSTILASSLKWVMAMEKGRLSSKNERQLTFYPTPDETLLAATRHNAIQYSLGMAKTVKSAGFRYPPSLAVAMHYIMAMGSGQERSDGFFDLVARGEGLAAADPAYTLREQLYFDSVKLIRRSTLNIAVWTILAWNAWNERRSIKVLKYYPDRPFPLVYAERLPSVFGEAAPRIYDVRERTVD